MLFQSCFTGEWWQAGVIVGGIFTGITLDKFYDGRYRKLEKHEEKNTL